MARWRKVDVRMQVDKKYRQLSAAPPNAQTLWTDLLVGRRTTNIPGVVIASLGVLADDRGWSLDATRDAIQEAIALGMAEADFEAGLIWLPGAPRQECNKPNGPNTVKSWGSTFDEIPECPLKVTVWKALHKWAKELGESFEAAFDSAIGDAMQDAIPNGQQDAIPDPVTGTGEGTGEREALPPCPVKQGSKFSQAKQLWSEQEAARDRLRAAGIACSPLGDAPFGRIEAVQLILGRGHTVEQCRRVLAVYEAEARTKRTAQYFDGVGNWKPENFDRALAKPVPATAAARADEQKPFDHATADW